jgi:hypothetical protein
MGWAARFDQAASRMAITVSVRQRNGACGCWRKHVDEGGSGDGPVRRSADTAARPAARSLRWLSTRDARGTLASAALRADRQGRGAAREATRRRTGIGAARRRARETRPRHPDETGHVGHRTRCFAISRLIEGLPPAPRSPTPVIPTARDMARSGRGLYCIGLGTAAWRYPGAPADWTRTLAAPAFGRTTADQRAGRCDRRRTQPGA